MQKVIDTLQIMCELYNHKLSKIALQSLLDEMVKYSNSESEIIKALKLCRHELYRFPTLLDIIDRIDGGFPSPNEAWAKCPKTDRQSVVWTKEIQEAYNLVEPLIYANDLYSARLAFIDRYSKLIKVAKMEKKKPVWSVSLGECKHEREVALLEAKKLNILNLNQKKMLELKNISNEDQKIKALCLDIGKKKEL